MADLVVPTLGESITEAVISKWIKQVGETVAADEPVVELESDKVTMQLPAPVSGALTEQRFAQGATVKVGEVVGQIAAGAAATAAKPSAPAPASNGQSASAPVAAAKSAVSSPAAQKQAVTAASQTSHDSGEDDRLSPSARRAKREGKAPTAASASAPKVLAKSIINPPSAGAREEVVAMSPLRKRIAERLVEAQHSAAALTTFNEVDMGAIMALREKYKQDFVDSHKVKLGFMSFFVKACVAALKSYPGLNAEMRGESIAYKKFYDLGIAVSTEKGLIVPVLRDCDSRNFADVEKGIMELAVKARDSKLAIADLTGGTFTITNGGIYGSMMSTPLLNHPQTGILGMHNIVNRAVVVDNKIEIRPMMYLALTYDHRVVDGKEAVSFLVAVKERIEKPDRLLLDV